MKSSPIATLCAAIASAFTSTPWRASAFVVVGFFALTIAALRDGRPAQADPGLTAHEWGTFTSIAGTDGRPVQWTPVQLITGTPELPDFVEHFRSATYKGTLRGTVRMETPVIYFYTPHETKVSVRVSFAKGIITEWFPHASSLQSSAPLSDTALYAPHEDGGVTWDSVSITPNVRMKFPGEPSGSHYYAARNTSATPLTVPGPSVEQHEKFLFYRGVSTVDLPLTATVQPGGTIQFDSRVTAPISLVLVERRGDKIGYHVFSSVHGSVTLEIPSVSDTSDSLRGDLEDILVSQGLFRDEARAMIETWRDSWFEEGSRSFYIIPRSFLDSILPLSINPAPTKLVRVFVGRIELVTLATEKSIETALASQDGATLSKYGRFLDPILEIMAAEQSDPEAAFSRMFEELSSSYQ